MKTDTMVYIYLIYKNKPFICIYANDAVNNSSPEINIYLFKTISGIIQRHKINVIPQMQLYTDLLLWTKDIQDIIHIY